MIFNSGFMMIMISDEEEKEKKKKTDIEMKIVDFIFNILENFTETNVCTSLKRKDYCAMVKMIYISLR